MINRLFTKQETSIEDLMRELNIPIRRIKSGLIGASFYRITYADYDKLIAIYPDCDLKLVRI